MYGSEVLVSRVLYKVILIFAENGYVESTRPKRVKSLQSLFIGVRMPLAGVSELKAESSSPKVAVCSLSQFSSSEKFVDDEGRGGKGAEEVPGDSATKAVIRRNVLPRLVVCDKSKLLSAARSSASTCSRPLITHKACRAMVDTAALEDAAPRSKKRFVA